MDRRERYIARKSGQSNESPSFNVEDYDIDQLYNQFTPGYGDVEKFSLFPFTPNPSQVPFEMGDNRNPFVDIEREPLNNPTMNPAAAASLYEGNLDQALANRVAPRMAAKGGIISLVS